MFFQKRLRKKKTPEFDGKVHNGEIWFNNEDVIVAANCILTSIHNENTKQEKV